MNTQEYLEKIRSIQNNLLCFLDDLENVEENYQNLLATLEDLHVHDDKNELATFLHLMLKISNNHHRSSNFFDKILRILQYFKEDIKKYFTNHEIFNISKSNKRILLYFTEEKLITFDEYIYSRSKCDINEKSINCIEHSTFNNCESALEMALKIALKNNNTYDIAKLILSHPKIDTNLIKLEQKMNVKDDYIRNLLLGQNDNL